MASRNPTLPLDQIREMFDNEWVLVEVTHFHAPGQPSKGRVLSHDKSRMKIARETRTYHDANPHQMTHTLFSGDAIPEGVVVVLLESETTF